jgi:hypothetical protein
MARLIPSVDIDSIANLPERDVARALVEGLGEGCLIYHSYPWLRPERDQRGQEKYLGEGEADFVVLVPERGMLVLEVKGGDIQYDADGHRWYRRSSRGILNELSKDPFRQAERNCHVLAEQVRIRSFPGRETIPCPYGYAVVFPDCTTSSPNGLPPGAVDGNLWDARDLPWLGRRVMDLLARFRRSTEPRPLTPEDLARIRDGLSPAFRLTPLLSRRVAGQEEVLAQLTQQQDQALRGLYSHPRVLVRGTAGSGKTMLALARARRFAEQGQSTLLLCFNRSLAEWLRGQVPRGLEGLLAIRTFHGLCREWCHKAALAFQPPPRDVPEVIAFWRDVAADLLDRALDRVSERFEAVVVDEAQDFEPNWWTPIELLNTAADAGRLYVFYDPAQNIFVGDDLVLPDLPVCYELPTNCRNTRLIARHCGRVLGVELDVREEAPEGEDPLVHVAAQSDQRRALCERQLRLWISQGRLQPQQVAIVSPKTWRHTSIAGITSLSGIPLTDDLIRWWGGEAVLVTTVRAFKGLEAEAMILLDAIEPSPIFTRSDLYVACSRAKHLLTIIAEHPISERWADDVPPRTTDRISIQSPSLMPGSA